MSMQEYKLLLIFLFLNMSNLSHFSQNYSKTILEYEIFGNYSKITQK